MESIKISNRLCVKVFDSENFLKSHKKVNEYLTKVLGNSNANFEREYIDNINGDIFLQDKKVFIYILFDGNIPISFVIYSKKSNLTIALDTIFTNEEYLKLGFATILLRTSAIDLKEKNINSIIVNMQQDNYVFANLIDGFAKVEGNNLTKTENRYVFDIKNLNSEKIFQNIKKIAID